MSKTLLRTELEMKIIRSESHTIRKIIQPWSSRRRTELYCIGKRRNLTPTSQTCMPQCMKIDHHQDLKRCSGEVCRPGSHRTLHERSLKACYRKFYWNRARLLWIHKCRTARFYPTNRFSVCLILWQKTTKNELNWTYKLFISNKIRQNLDKK